MFRCACERWHIVWSRKMSIQPDRRLHSRIDKLNKSTSHFLCMSIAFIKFFDTKRICRMRDFFLRALHAWDWECGRERSVCDRRATADNRHHDIVQFHRMNTSREPPRRRKIFHTLQQPERAYTGGCGCSAVRLVDMSCENAIPFSRSSRQKSKGFFSHFFLFIFPSSSTHFLLLGKEL